MCQTGPGDVFKDREIPIQEGLPQPQTFRGDAAAAAVLPSLACSRTVRGLPSECRRTGPSRVQPIFGKYRRPYWIRTLDGMVKAGCV